MESKKEIYESGQSGLDFDKINRIL